MKSKNVLLRLLLAVFILTCLAACSDYDNPTKEAYEDYNRAKQESSLVDHSTLNDWINAGSANGRPLVIVDVLDAGAQFIKGALPMRYTIYLDGSRSDGLIKMSGMVPTGEQMDAFLSIAGITEKSTIVITGTWGGAVPNNVTRTWWIFKYWGFSNAQVKILNGGNEVFAYHHPENMVDTYQLPQPSNFSVKNIRIDVMDIYRASYGEVYNDALKGAYSRGEKSIISTLAAQQFGTHYMTTSGSNSMWGVPKGTGQVKDAASNLLTPDPDGSGKVVFKTDAEDISQYFVDINTGNNLLPTDKDIRLITFCGSGMSTSPWNFILQEILGYTNAAIYDGSMGEWNSLSRYRAAGITEPTPGTPAFRNYQYVSETGSNLNTGTERVLMYWDGDILKDADTNATISADYLIFYGQSASMKWDSTKASQYFILRTQRTSEVTTTYTGVVTSDIEWYYDGDGREVTREDREYKKSSASGSAGEGSQGGNGAAGAGC